MKSCFIFRHYFVPECSFHVGIQVGLANVRMTSGNLEEEEVVFLVSVPQVTSSLAVRLKKLCISSAIRLPCANLSRFHSILNIYDHNSKIQLVYLCCGCYIVEQSML